MENQQSNHNASINHAFCNDRIESLEKYIIELEEKNAYLTLANENLATQRDAAMKRAKEKGERSAEVIRAYRTALKFGVEMCKKNSLINDITSEFLELANHALEFRRESNG